MIDLPEDRASVAPPLGLSTWMVASTRPSNAALGGGRLTRAQCKTEKHEEEIPAPLGSCDRLTIPLTHEVCVKEGKVVNTRRMRATKRSPERYARPRSGAEVAASAAPASAPHIGLAVHAAPRAAARLQAPAQ